MTKRNVIGAILGLGVVGSLVLAGCGSGGSGNTSTSTSATSGSSAPAASSSSGAPAAKSGGGAAGGGVLKTVSGYDELKLPFNEQVFGVAGQACSAPCFDQGGNSLDPTDPAWPNKGAAGDTKAGSVPLYFAGVKGKTGLNFGPEEGGTVTVNVGGSHKYKTMYVVAGAGNGPGTADITFTYSDGSKDTAQETVDDWCSTSPTGGTALWTPADRFDPNGNSISPACGVFLDTVPIPGTSKTLKSITFANDSGNGSNFEPNILAITLQQA